MSTPAAGPWTKYAQQQPAEGPWTKYAQPATTNGLTPQALAANKARNAQPTQFEKDRAGDTAVSNVINQVTHPLQPNPHANANSPWFEQANGQQPGQPFSLNRLLDSPAGKAAHEANVNAAKFGADSMIGTNIVGPPLARIAESHVLPALKALPFAGKVVSAIDEAPGLIGKAARGATVGGVTGGTEGLIRGHGLAGSAKDAAEGAGFGAAAGLALPAIHKLSGVEPIPDLKPIKGPSTPIRQSPNFNAEEYNAGRKGTTAAAPDETPTQTSEGVQLPQQDVIRVPEPRAKFPGEKEGYNASTPRRLVLDNAMQGRPGAAEMLRNMGKTPLFVPEGGYAPPRESFKMGSPVSLGEGEDLGPGFGTQHTIQKNGNRIGSVTVEPKGEGNLHVHWLGGDLADNGVTRTHVVNSLKEQYPGTENITYDRRRLAKGDTAATTEPRSMKISGPGE